MGRTTRPGEEPRASIEQAIGLRFKHFGEFIDEVAANVSIGGMFIRTHKPHPVGSVFEFEVRWGGDRLLIGGKAQVAWVRRRSEQADRPAGMGVRFVELDDASRQQVVDLVAAHKGTGGHPVEIAPLEEASPSITKATAASEGLAAVPPATANRPAAAPMPAAVWGAAEARPPRTLWSRRILITLSLAASLAAVFWLRPAPQPMPADDEAPVVPPTAVNQPAVSQPVDNPKEAASAGAKPAAIQAVERWAQAWSEQRVDDYLDAYSRRFEVPGGLDRERWAEQRRTRILNPASIDVGLAFVEFERTGTDRGRVRFVQAYESDNYRDVVRKVLDLERERDGWKILRETVEP